MDVHIDVDIGMHTYTHTRKPEGRLMCQNVYKHVHKHVHKHMCSDLCTNMLYRRAYMHAPGHVYGGVADICVRCRCVRCSMYGTQARGNVQGQLHRHVYAHSHVQRHVYTHLRHPCNVGRCVHIRYTYTHVFTQVQTHLF